MTIEHVPPFALRGIARGARRAVPMEDAVDSIYRWVIHKSCCR